MGERSPLAIIDPEASGRMAVGEALRISRRLRRRSEPSEALGELDGCADQGAEDAALFDTVRAVALDLCPALGISIPVGKDSLSMRTAWEEGGRRGR